MYQPAFNKIHHIAIIAADYEKSRQFYVDILGFSIIRENHRPEKGDIKLDLKMNEETELLLSLKPVCQSGAWQAGKGIIYFLIFLLMILFIYS